MMTSEAKAGLRAKSEKFNRGRFTDFCETKIWNNDQDDLIKEDKTLNKNVNKKQKTAEAILNRPLRRSKEHEEVYEEIYVQTCIGFCNPPRKFRAISKYNKICPQCKLSERWREF